MIDSNIIAASVGVLGTAVLGMVGYCIRLGTRMSVQEALFREKSNSVNELGEKTDEHATRITAIESIVPELRHLTDSLRDVPAVLVALKEMILSDRARTRDIEQRLNRTAQILGGSDGQE